MFKLILTSCVIGSFLLTFYWHKLPGWNFLKKDLSNTEIQIANKKFKLSGFTPEHSEFSAISNSKFINLYRTYRIRDKSFLYKALVSEKRFAHYKAYLVVASTVEEIASGDTVHAV